MAATASMFELIEGICGSVYLPTGPISSHADISATVDHYFGMIVGTLCCSFFLWCSRFMFGFDDDDVDWFMNIHILSVFNSHLNAY